MILAFFLVDANSLELFNLGLLVRVGDSVSLFILFGDTYSKISTNKEVLCWLIV
jgi:hypothetical protein